MVDPKAKEAGKVGAEDVRILLERASQIDASLQDARLMSELRESAVEAGIKPEAFDAAVREFYAKPEVAAIGSTKAPWWVRLRMTGVPDRSAAMKVFWLFLILMMIALALL